MVGVREYKPHLFKHNCKKCFKSGLMKCPKCDGFGVMERVARDTRRAMTIQRRMTCLLHTSPSPRDYAASRMPSSA